jgi:hypothetical protein
MDRVYLKVKQGEELGIGFTIKQGGRPFNLDGYNVLVQVKNNPTVKSKALVDKVITTVSNEEEVGIIDSPNLGKFTLHLTKEDTSFPIGEYYLVIAIQNDREENIISSTNCTTAVYEICAQ